jgi:transposase
VSLETIEVQNQTAIVHLHATSSTALCPQCGTPGSRVHSRYVRTIADVAFGGRSLVLKLQVRKWICREESWFRTYHGGQWTMRILEVIVQELKTLSIDLTLSQERAAILPVFVYQIERHKNLADTDFPVAGSLPKLPL